VSEAFVARLAERRGLTPAQIRTAVRFAQLASHEPRMPVEALIERQLSQCRPALGTTPAARRPRAVVTQYDLSLLNVESASRSAHRRGAAPARPRHAVFPRFAR
jgi:hypothetical protein